ncbi:MAG TPA: hypothetical protein VLD59_06650 [Steroidobacteraceae bacterium]|nr:hypothetical protein [Steroidobacteraceae bacterium]
MSLPESIVAAQLQALLEHLERDRDRRCSAESASARERARAIVRSAFGEARKRMREAVRYERSRLEESLVLRRAEFEAARRREEHAAFQLLVRRACDALPALLERRWSDGAVRREWCEGALAAAALRLRGTDWTIEIAPGAGEEERSALLARAAALRAGSHTLSERSELVAGLNVHAAGATLDATVAGLLDDRAAIGSRFLHEWLRDQAQMDKGVTP